MLVRLNHVHKNHSHLKQTKGSLEANVKVIPFRNRVFFINTE